MELFHLSYLTNKITITINISYGALVMSNIKITLIRKNKLPDLYRGYLIALLEHQTASGAYKVLTLSDVEDPITVAEDGEERLVDSLGRYWHGNSIVGIVITKPLCTKYESGMVTNILSFMLYGSDVDSLWEKTIELV